MARCTLILILLALLSSCASFDKEMHAASVMKGKSEAKMIFPTLPASCTAKMGRAFPSLNELHIITQKRWEIIADIRDREAADCDAWWQSYSGASSNGGSQ